MIICYVLFDNETYNVHKIALNPHFENIPKISRVFSPKKQHIDPHTGKTNSETDRLQCQNHIGIVNKQQRHQINFFIAIENIRVNLLHHVQKHSMIFIIVSIAYDHKNHYSFSTTVFVNGVSSQGLCRIWSCL